MVRLDPFIIYTIRLVMEKMSNDTNHTKKAYSATTTAQIMSIQAWPEIQFDKPSLKIDHLMSLLYHAGRPRQHQMFTNLPQMNNG